MFEPISDVVAECAAQRASAQPKPMTESEAVEYAKWIVGTPDGLANKERVRECVGALLAMVEARPS